MPSFPFDKKFMVSHCEHRYTDNVHCCSIYIYIFRIGAAMQIKHITYNTNSAHTHTHEQKVRHRKLHRKIICRIKVCVGCNEGGYINAIDEYSRWWMGNVQRKAPPTTTTVQLCRRKEQIEGIKIEKQQHSHGHKFDVTPVLRATFFELQQTLEFEFKTNKMTIRQWNKNGSTAANINYISHRERLYMWSTVTMKTILYKSAACCSSQVALGEKVKVISQICLWSNSPLTKHHMLLVEK